MLIKQDNYGEVSVVQNEKYQFGVMNSNGEMIVDFGKYFWISGFDHGLARVKNIVGDFSNEVGIKWGLINEYGHEVLPVIFDEIWNFLNKGRRNTRVIINDYEMQFDFFTRSLSLVRINSNEEDDFLGEEYCCGEDNNYDLDDDYGTHFGEYAGTYAQDEMGYSDEVIDDAFEGDPDNYWNID